MPQLPHRSRSPRFEALAPVIFAGAAPAAVAEMLPEDKRESFAHQFAKFEPAFSLFNGRVA